MSNPNYVAGRNYEYRIKKMYEMTGFEVCRTAGSHSNFDLIAIKPNHITFMQLKAYEPGKTELERELEKLLETVAFGPSIVIEKALVTKVNGKPVTHVNYYERYDRTPLSQR